MAINPVSSSHNASAHAPTPQPVKKPTVNFSDLMNAGQAAQQQAATAAGANAGAQPGKV